MLKSDIITAVDMFCGAGGTSTGLIQAAEENGKKINLTAINHWNIAIQTHKTNHPQVRHLCENLDNVNPRHLFPDGRINLLVASPECTHHSIARGGTPCSDQSRATAWRIVEWANALYIENILVENVPEFQSWGPLGSNGKPLKSKKGETFRAFIMALESLGYRVDFKVLNTADYGDPTSRRRFFLIARRGNKKIKWPEPTHTEKGGKHLFGETEQWVPAKKIIDWSIPGKSIFNRKKPLAKKTMNRIEYGLNKFGGKDFLVKYFGTGKGVSLDNPIGTITANGQNYGLCEPSFITIMKGQSMSRSLKEPLPTLTTQNNMYLCQPFMVGIDHAGAGEKYVRSIEKPAPTVITQQNYALVQAFLIKYFGTGKVKSLDLPLDTVTTKDRFGLVEVFEKTPFLDIRLRMLQPHELAAAQSFPEDYTFSGNKGEVVKQIGNAVPRKTAKALCKALLN